MEIIQGKSIPVKFGDLKIGDTFSDSGDFIKALEIETDSMTYTAFSFDKHCMVWIDDDCYVVPTKCQLVVL